MRPSAVLREQDGVISLAQAVAAGVSERTVRRWVAEGRRQRLHPGVHLAEGRLLGPTAIVGAAWLWGGPSTVVSGPAAAFWFGLLERPPGPVELTVPHRFVKFDHVVDAYLRNMGARGWVRARDLLTSAADGAASRAERRLVALLVEAGIHGWVVGFEIGIWTLDVAFPDARIAIGFDSWAWHSDHERFRRDRRKGNEIVLAGWTLLRVTWFDLAEAPARVIAEIRHAILHASGPA